MPQNITLDYTSKVDDESDEEGLVSPKESSWLLKMQDKRR
jgi:hypothetical protein